MCGITGFWEPSGVEETPASARVARMANAVAHRGPEDSGSWADGHAGSRRAPRGRAESLLAESMSNAWVDAERSDASEPGVVAA